MNLNLYRKSLTANQYPCHFTTELFIVLCISRIFISQEITSNRFIAQTRLGASEWALDIFRGERVVRSPAAFLLPMAAVLVHAQRVPPVAHIAALVATVLDSNVLGLHVIDHVVAVFALVAALQAAVHAGRVVAYHAQRDDPAQISCGH